MEDNNNLEINNLSQIICRKCGLPLILYSYKENQDSNQVKIQMQLKCQNNEHTKTKEIDFEEYYNLLKKYPHKVCKCMNCNKILINNKNAFYCYNCKQIICSFCLNGHKNGKNHSNIKEFYLLKNKCLIHYNNGNGNDITYCCLKCKQNLCLECKKNDSKHLNNIKSIDEIISDEDNNNSQIQKEMDDLSKKFKILEKKKLFQDFIKKNNAFYLLKDNNNSVDSSLKIFINPYFNINNNINNNTNNNINNINKNTNNNINYNTYNNIHNNIKNYPINIIYYNDHNKTKLNTECEIFRNATKGNIILTNDQNNLELVLKYIIKNNKKNKFFLIVNGRSAEKTINFINNNNNNKYRELFIYAFIFTKNGDYENLKNKHKNFIKEIFTNGNDIFKIINNHFENIYLINKEFYINSIINEYLIRDKYLRSLYKELSSYYGKNPPNNFLSNMKDFLQNIEFPNEIVNHLINKFEMFINNFDDYKDVIRNYLNDLYFAKIINSLLNKKEISIFKEIGYYAGNLMYSLVKYGKNENKGIKDKKTFYCGMELNIIEMMEFLKNKKNKITFPYFFSMTTNEDWAYNSSKRDRSKEERQEKELYSVKMKINYSPSLNYEPCIFEVKDLSLSPDAEEYILLPFTYIDLFSIDINSEEYSADIQLNITDKNAIFENLKKIN